MADSVPPNPNFPPAVEFQPRLQLEKFKDHEVYLSNVEGLLGFTSQGHKLSLGAGYDYTLVGGLQWGLSANFTDRKDEGGRETYAELLLGPTLSYPFTDQANSWFFRSGLGVVYDDFDFPAVAKKDRYLKFASSIEIGKRFRIFQNLIYRPSVQLLTVYGQDVRQRFAFNIRFISISGFF